MEYDHENRLTASDIDAVSATYTYNGDGLRVSRNIGGTSVSYTWDVAAALPVILQDSQSNTYVYGLDLISRTDSTRPYVLNGVQWLDILPLGVVPVFGTVPGAILDAAAFLASEYQILANDCISNSQTVALTGNNAFNLIVGETGNLIAGVPGFEWVAAPTAIAELTSFEFGQAALNCRVAYSSGTGSKE